MIKKLLVVVAIIFLFIGMGVVSSNRNSIDDTSASSCIQHSVDRSEGLLSNTHIAYALGSYENYTGLFEFELPNFSNFSWLCSNILIDYIGGTWCHVNESIYVTDEDGGIFVIDLETCIMTYLGNSGTGELVDLSYDPYSNTLYGISSSSFYKIDMKDGSATLIGPMGTGTLMACIDCDRCGNMYGVDLDFASSCLYYINSSNGHATPIGNLGVTISYPHLAYDKDNDILYIIFFNYITFRPELYIVNVTTGHSSYLDNVPFGVSVFTIPYFYIFSQPPDPPIINGRTSGKIGVEYEYNFSISDLDNNSMYLRVDWGSGIPGKWDGPFPSGSIIKYNYTWKKKGTYTIKAQTKDSNGLQSDWGQLTVTMPRDKAISNSMILWFLERYPMLCRLIGNVFYFYQW